MYVCGLERNKSRDQVFRMDQGSEEGWRIVRGMGQALNSAFQVIDASFFELFCGAVGTALEYVRQAETGKTHIGTHGKWPELQKHEENGLPWITTRYPEPKNYGDAIGGLYSVLFALGTGKPPLDFIKEQSFLALVEYAKANPRLRQYLFLEREDFDFGTTRLQGLVADVLDCYIHRNNTTDLDRAKLLPIYVPIEKHLFAATLPVVVVVPILFLKFDFSRLQISNSVSLETLSDEFHIARGWRGPYSDDNNSLVESAATHGLFIQGLSMENENWLKAGRIEMEPESYPVEQIDTFFAAIRIVTGYPTGYAQMVSVPVGWTNSYEADIAPLSGPRVEKYPPFFKHGYWKKQVPTVTSSDAEEIKHVFNGFQQVFNTKHAKKVRLAMNRLNLSSTRTTDEDGIIDSMIAVEALLSDGVQEMTHKVALRLATLYKTFDRSRVEQVFAEMKQIYAFRSNIVHGSADLDKRREITRDKGKISTIDAAVEHLRIAFAVLIKHPEFLDPKRIDTFLLTDTFESQEEMQTGSQEALD